MNKVSLKAFFGFTRHPFPPACPPHPLFCSERMERALETLKIAPTHRLHGLLLGAPGLGKSCLLRLLTQQLNPRDFTVALVNGMPLSVTECLQYVAERFGIETGARRGAAVRFLRLGLEKMRTTPTLILDEAQRVPMEALDMLRNLAEDAQRPLLSMILAGDESLRHRLARQAHTALAQRLAARIELEQPDENETALWIEHAFQVVKMENILAPTAVAPLYGATNGVPREVGRILVAAMNLALEKQSRILSDEIIQEILDGQLLQTS